MAKTAKIEIAIPEEMIDDYTKKLEKDLTNALKREAKLKTKVNNMKYEVEVARKATEKFYNVIEELRFEEPYEDLFIGDYA